MFMKKNIFYDFVQIVLYFLFFEAAIFDHVTKANFCKIIFFTFFWRTVPGKKRSQVSLIKDVYLSCDGSLNATSQKKVFLRLGNWGRSAW